MLPYGRQWVDESDIDAVAAVLRGDWLTTGPAVDTFEAALAEVQEERQRIARETSRLETPAAIEERAREELGFQRPDEETYNVLPVPSEPLGLPDAWPFTGVERALGSQ